MSKTRLFGASRCSNCGRYGSHFVPPSFGEEGFFICKSPTEHEGCSYIESYKEYDIFQDEEDGYFIVFGDDDMPISREATRHLIKLYIDEEVGRSEI